MAAPPPRVDSILNNAVEIASPEERAAYLDKACGGDAQLRARLGMLVRAHFRAGGFLEQPIAGDRFTKVRDIFTNAEELPDAPREEISFDFLEACDVPGRLGKLGTYEVIDVVGRGGMGVVLRAHDCKLNRVVAVKVLSPTFGSNPTARKRFLREAKAAAAVSHPHVVSIHAIEEAPTTPYLVMEYVDGPSLQEKISQIGTLPVNEILRIGSQIASGLVAAHSQGLIHRDIKPANILLENGVERVKITDFGLARAVDDVALTRTGELAGTPEFMSPEQAAGQVVDQRSDLFSLGSVLYAMCTGRSPFRADTTVAVLRRICDDAPRPIREVNPEIPEALVVIINRLLAKNPDDRLQTADEVAELLGQQLAYRQHSTGATPSGPPNMFKNRPGDKYPRRPHRSTRRRWFVLGLALLSVLVSLSVTEATGVTQFTSSMLHIVTGEGTLIVAIDDPNVSVTLEDQDIVITGAGPKEVRLKPGKYRLSASKNGTPVPLEQNLAKITRGGRVVVNVTMVSPEVKEEVVPIPSDAPPWSAVLPAEAPLPAVAPFDSATAKEHQQSWSDFVGQPVKWENSIGMQFVLIPPGEFVMGSSQAEIDELMKSRVYENWLISFLSEGPQHRVRITRPFYFAVCEVTEQNYAQVMGSVPGSVARSDEGNKQASISAAGEEGKHESNSAFAERLPVANVSWMDAVTFCNKLSELEELQPCYSIEEGEATAVKGTGYRLATEAEWEYTCRAGSMQKFCFGDNWLELEASAWYVVNASAESHTVGQKLPNGFGVYDMHGNIWEWCQDLWDDKYYAHSPSDDPQGPTKGTEYVFRGGGWGFPSLLCRSAFHAWHEPMYHSRSIGIRVVKVLNQ